MASSLNFLFTANEQRVTAALDGFERGLYRISQGLQNALYDLPYWEPTTRQLMLRSIVNVQSQLRGQMNQLGYDDLVQKFMTNGYDPAAVFSKTVFAALGKSELILSPMRTDILQQLKQFDYSAFTQFGNVAIQQVSKEVVLNAIGGKRRGQIIVDLKNSLGVKFSQAQVMADTALRSFDRTVQAQTAAEAGVDKFKYFGPNDKVTRLFCKERVGKTYTLAQIKKMDNGSKQFGDVQRYGGGARCRHTWLPIAEVGDGQDQ